MAETELNASGTDISTSTQTPSGTTVTDTSDNAQPDQTDQASGGPPQIKGTPDPGSGPGPGPGSDSESGQPEHLQKLSKMTAELEQYRLQAERLKALTQAVEEVFTTTDTAQADAIRRTLETLGWSRARIREFFRANAAHFEQDANMSTDPDTSHQNPTPEPQESPQNSNVSEGDAPRTPQELEILARTLEQMRANFIRKELNSALDNVLKTDKDCNKILTAIESRPAPDPAAKEKAKSVVRTKIEKEALDILRFQRDKAGGMFDESWIPDAVAQAAKAVVEEYRSVIGDFSYLGKTPETVSEEDRIVSTPPVPPPDFKPNKRVGDYEAEVEKYTVDLIRRMVLENRGTATSKA